MAVSFMDRFLQSLQVAVLQKLEKAKEKWHKAAQLRKKAHEAEQRALADAERAKAKAKAAAEEEVLKYVSAYPGPRHPFVGVQCRTETGNSLCKSNI